MTWKNQDINCVLRAGGTSGHLSWSQGTGPSVQKGALHVPGDEVDHRGRKAAEVIGPGAGAESVR